MRYLKGWLRRDRGSMAVEFVVAVPAIVLLLLLVSAGGQWLDLTGDVGSAARDAVRAASLARDFTDAQARAQNAARADLGGVCGGGPAVKVQLFSGGGVVGSAGFPAARDIEVTVTCLGSLEAFHAVGFPVRQTFGDTAAAPLDPFEDRGT
jgi:Flp pilus assembly protein TadG